MAADVPISAEPPQPGTVVGIDVGVAHLATTSNGEMFDNVRSFDRKRRKLRKASRALARCKRASKRRRKVRERLAKIQRSIANVRSNHLHQVSAELARRYALIGVEKLKTKNMTRPARGSADEPGKNVRQKAGLNRAMLDASPARLIQLLTYKAERAGGVVVKVDPRGARAGYAARGRKRGASARALSRKRGGESCLGSSQSRKSDEAQPQMTNSLNFFSRRSTHSGMLGAITTKHYVFACPLSPLFGSSNNG